MTSTPNSRRPESAIVVGGGLIGLLSAYYLRKQGLHVTVLDAQSAGSGSSRGNCGEIVPSLVGPLSTPGILRESAGSVFKSDSALFIHPQLSTEMLRFMVRFIRNTRPRTYQQTVGHLREFSADVFDLYDEMEDDGVPLHRNREGFLFLFEKAAAAQEALANQRAMIGGVGELLSSKEVRIMEPSLSPRVGAGYLLRDQWSIDPSAFVDSLVARLTADSVVIRESTPANRITVGPRSVSVHTPRGVFEADTCVVAAGVWSRDLCRTLGYDLDIVPGKGYSFNVDLPHPLRHTLQFADVHVVATPMGDQVRIAGTMELDRDRDLFNPGRVNSIIAAARPFLTEEVDWTTRRNEWVGPRPMTADGMPIIGPLPNQPRVFVAAGHGMHGLTLGAVTGRMVARLITDPTAACVSNPFDPGTGGRTRRWRQPMKH